MAYSTTWELNFKNQSPGQYEGEWLPLVALGPLVPGRSPLRRPTLFVLVSWV